MSWVTVQWPWMLLLLGVLPLVYRSLRRAEKLNLQSVRALGGSVTDFEKAQSYRRRVLFVVLSLLIIALSRPGYAPERRSIDQAGRDVIFLLDVSRSMQARDCYPSRLEASKQAVRDCLQSLNRDRVALVLYAGSSSILCPLTSDFNFLQYMLGQANSEAVDHGGTFLQGAVEKVMDQVLDKERSNFQDLIILTDGEDHGPAMEKVAEVLNQAKSSILVVGIGDPEAGSKIPVQAEDGTENFLKYQGNYVLTKLEARGLVELANLCQGEYFPAETKPFHLGDVYQKFSEGKERDGGIGSDFEVVYKEVSFFLMGLAVLLLLLLEFPVLALCFKKVLSLLGSRSAKFSLLVLMVLSVKNLAQETVEDKFAKALSMTQREAYSEANMVWKDLSVDLEIVSSEGRAAIAFNYAMSLKKFAQVISQESTEDVLHQALSYCRQAQRLLLKAARLQPEFRRSSYQLQQIDALIGVIEKKLEKQRTKGGQIQEELHKVVQQLRELKNKQRKFEKELVSKARLKQRSRRKRTKEQKLLDKQAIPTVEEIQECVKQQAEFVDLGQQVYEGFVDVDNRMLAMISGGGDEDDQMPVQSLLKEPIRWMKRVVENQEKAHEFLANFDLWWPATEKQRRSVTLMNKVLALFPSRDNATPRGADQWEENYDEQELEDGGAPNTSFGSSAQMGVYTEGLEMPPPNFSAQEIVAEELANKQFRKQERKKSTAQKVKKDW